MEVQITEALDNATNNIYKRYLTIKTNIPGIKASCVDRRECYVVFLKLWRQLRPMDAER